MLNREGRLLSIKKKAIFTCPIIRKHWKGVPSTSLSPPLYHEGYQSATPLRANYFFRLCDSCEPSFGFCVTVPPLGIIVHGVRTAVVCFAAHTSISGSYVSALSTPGTQPSSQTNRLRFEGDPKYMAFIYVVLQTWN